MLKFLCIKKETTEWVDVEFSTKTEPVLTKNLIEKSGGLIAGTVLKKENQSGRSFLMHQ